MEGKMGRYPAETGVIATEELALRRLTQPSQLHGANGLRTGRDECIYIAQVPGSQINAIDVDSGGIETIIAMGSAIVGPDELACDEASNLYATEITDGRISVLAMTRQEQG